MDERDNTETPEVGIRRACDQCRLRKIRCDKGLPCANCRTANRSCSSTGVAQKPKEPRQRVLISSQYERKIDHFESRLASIERMLRDLTTSLAQNNNNHHRTTPEEANHHSGYQASTAASSTVGDGTDTLYGGDDEDDLDTAFEGNSSMAAQTALASEFLENAVTQTHFRDLNPNMQSALSSLKQIARMRHHKTTHEARFAHAKPLPRSGVRELPMPPMSLVIEMLREMKENPPLTFSLMCAFIAVDEFAEYCRKVYFPAEEYSVATFIIVNAGLCYLFGEKSIPLEGAAEAGLLRHHHLCRDNLETALASLPMLLPARMENIQALLLGASYAVEISKFTLAYQLNTSAALMCQALGYHRLPIPNPDEANPYEARSALFWAAYMLDKGLSLRFGRSSAIQDYDISMPKSIGQLVNGSDPWKVVLNLWIVHAELMGKVYEQLYSPAALAQPPERRLESARHLIVSLKKLAKDSEELGRQARAPGSGFKEPGPMGVYSIKLVLLSDEVSHWSSMTLIYRAIPATPGLPSSFNPECLEAARRATAAHHECMKLTEANLFVQVAYLHWTILYAPFIPYIVLFCHVIETSDADDLRRMADFVASVAPNCSHSEAIDKLHRVCQVLCNVAQIYVEAKAQAALQQPDQEMSLAGHDFDMYLSQLGFMTQTNDGLAGAANAGDGGFMNPGGNDMMGGGMDANLATSQLSN
ncbi:hypothetical protein B0T17DRAFT_410286 [Bombardia bombarda]|uniref:Zn(2)-C6 fungal-type domain-containing protein n=1 Tax=Bombardia bombarda TaxID=252184 RepID=A0AA39TID8_9PEZI|nr:hypothetical protein B0T17DRAFT_410286 [Bombardia bombarda]